MLAHSGRRIKWNELCKQGKFYALYKTAQPTDSESKKKNIQLLIHMTDERERERGAAVN
jgi:hypothetical protein